MTIQSSHVKEQKTDIDLLNTTQKTKNEGSKPHKKPVVNSGVPEGQEIPAPLATPVINIT
jgi:hypothetical protein